MKIKTRNFTWLCIGVVLVLVGYQVSKNSSHALILLGLTEVTTTIATPTTTTTTRTTRTTTTTTTTTKLPRPGPVKVELFHSWTTSDPKDVHFVRRLYLYSAIIDIHNTATTTNKNTTHVHLTTFQEGRSPVSYQCCLRLHRDPVLTHRGSLAAVDFTYAKPNNNPKDLEVTGYVYRCHFDGFSQQDLVKSKVTLTTDEACPAKDDDYVAVVHPELRPGGLAICAKTAYGYNLNPHRLVEWFEVQRLLGVDKIQLFDLNNTAVMRSVFKHYQDEGLLTLLPYKLPGRPWGRTIFRNTNVPSWGQEEDLPIWDCRLRLAGYTHIMGIDMDEVIMPRKSPALKPFFQEHFKKHPEAGSLFFHVQFFVLDWSPTAPEESLTMLKYVNSTEPRWECQKYVYLPTRVHQARTHVVYHNKGSNSFTLPKTEATILHYRQCPRGWKTCQPKKITDRVMHRSKGKLVPAVTAAKRAIGL